LLMPRKKQRKRAVNDEPLVKNPDSDRYETLPLRRASA
jgi:hypothetical protein